MKTQTEKPPNLEKALEPVRQIQRSPVATARKRALANIVSGLFLIIGLSGLIIGIYYVRSFLGGTVLNKVAAPKPVLVQQQMAVPTLVRPTASPMLEATVVATTSPDAVAVAVNLPVSPEVLPVSATPSVTATSNSNTSLPEIAFVAKPAPNALAGAPNPLFGPNYDPNDGRPVFICGTDSFASYLTLLQIQVADLDTKHGFHLGIVPLQLNDKEYALSQQQINTALKTGAWDCNPNTVDGVASTGIGIVTAIVDESAGGDGIWARELNTIYDLKGKRIAYVADSSSEFFVRYALSVAQLNPATDAILVPFDTPDAAVQAFNDRKADAVSAWEPQLSQAGKGGGKPLVTSDQLRVIVDAIITSRKSIAERPEVVQAFHDAWFEALKFQFEHFEDASQQIAAWGDPDWIGITKDSAARDFDAALHLIAQASLEHNVALMSNPEPILNLMATSRQIWSQSRKVPNDPAQDAIDGRFVKQAAVQPNAQTSSRPVNNTFSLVAGSAAYTAPVQTELAVTLPLSASAVQATEVSTSTILSTPAEITGSFRSPTSTESLTTLAVLPCRKFSFLPDSAVLTSESQRVLDICVLPAMQQRPGSLLRVKGSAAWPGPKGTYTEAQILEIATARAKAVADYLIGKGIDRSRIGVEGTLPPASHREITDGVLQAEDRYVEMSLLSGGR